MLSQALKQGTVTVTDHVVRESWGWDLSYKEPDMKRPGERRFLVKETASNAWISLVSSDHVTLLQWLPSHPEGKPKSSPWPPKPARSAFPHSTSLTSRLFCSTSLTTTRFHKRTGHNLCLGLGTGCSLWGNSLLPPMLTVGPLTFQVVLQCHLFSDAHLDLLIKKEVYTHCWYFWAV